jgi:hypothetical protein
MISLSKTFPATSDAAVAEFEQEIGIQLPEDYRRFLLTYNGGEPVDGEFQVPGWGFSVVHVFYGLGTGFDAYNLDWSRVRFEEVFPDSITPIARDPGGCLVCLGVQGRPRGKVYFWDRGQELDELVLLAPSFDSFVAALKPSGTFK